MSVGTFDGIFKGLALLGLAGVMGGAIWLLVGRIRTQAAQRRLFSGRWKHLIRLARTQGDAIAAVIGELESRPATYETFPDDVRERLFAVHSEGTALTNGKEFR